MPDWPHAPLHRFTAEGVFFVTGSTYLKRHLFRYAESRDRLRDLLFALAREHGCELQSWAIFSDHIHIVAKGKGALLREMLTRLYVESAIDCNRRDGTKGRQVWYQCRDTELTFEKSWLARLRYTNENAVHHGLVRIASQYPWCSAGWFERTASPAFVKTVASFKIDRVNVPDDFDPV